MTTLDEEIEAAKLHLYALYKKRRELRAAARPPPRPQLQDGEVLARAKNGQALEAIAAEFQLRLARVRDHLDCDICSQFYQASGELDDWREEYRFKIRINDTLPPENRLRRRRLWPWRAATYDGVAWNDPCWT